MSMNKGELLVILVAFSATLLPNVSGLDKRYEDFSNAPGNEKFEKLKEKLK
jgi:hypothetical protein